MTNLFKDFITSGAFLIFIGVIGLIFFLFRGINLWYWKINRIEKLLEKIEQNTKK